MCSGLTSSTKIDYETLAGTVIGIKLTRSPLGVDTLIGRPMCTGLRAGSEVDWVNLAGTAVGIHLRIPLLKAITPLWETHVH